MRSTQIKALTHTTLGLPIDLHTQQISCSNRTCSIQRSEALRAIRESKPKRINSNAIHAYPSSHPPEIGTPVRPVHPADLLLQRKLLNPELRSSAHVKMHQTIGSTRWPPSIPKLSWLSGSSSNTIRQPAQSAHLGSNVGGILGFALLLLHRHRESIDRSKDLNQTSERVRAWQMLHCRHTDGGKSIAPEIAREGRETRWRCGPDQRPGRRETAS
jgi:hypothetical protein